MPAFDIEAALDKPYLEFEGEFDSPYPKEAVRGNVERLAVRAVRDGDVVGVAGRRTDITMKCFPYRDGSKCRYRVDLTAPNVGGTLDFTSAAQSLKATAARIAAD